MSERIFTPLLAFMLLAGGTFAIGSELFRAQPANVAEVASVQLPRVEVTGHRVAVATVTLPRVEITGRRAAAVATATLPRVEVTGRRIATTMQLAESAGTQDCRTDEAATASARAPATHI